MRTIALLLLTTSLAHASFAESLSNGQIGPCSVVELHDGTFWLVQAMLADDLVSVRSADLETEHRTPVTEFATQIKRIVRYGSGDAEPGIPGCIHN